MLYAIVGALVIILDQWVKFWVADAIAYGTGVKTFIPGVISLINIHNDGAAFSILSGGGARVYFIALTGIFAVAVIIALATRFISGRVARWSIVLVTAGGLSNCIDRMIYGYVQDMFKVELFNFAVFNVADIFITVFAIVFAIAMIFEKDQPLDDEDSVLFEKDDEEEDRPSRRRKAERSAAREAKEYREPKYSRVAREPRELEETEQPKRRPRPSSIEDIEKPSRKERRAKYEEEYEQYKANRAARLQQNPAAAAAAAQQKAPAHNPADPFAEWEKASAKVASQQVNTPAAKAADISEFSVPQNRIPLKQPVAEEPAPVVAAAKEVKPVSVSADEFSLDDILNEFK